MFTQHAKAGHHDRIFPVMLQLKYHAIQQLFNSGYWWSIFSDERDQWL